MAGPVEYIEESPHLRMRMQPQREEGSAIVQAVLRRWWLYGLFALISAGVAFVYASHVETKSYRIQGAIFHEGLPAEATAFLDPVNLTTTRELFYLPGNLQHLIDRHGLTRKVELLQKQIECDIGLGSSLIQFSAVWNEHEQGAAVVTGAMKLFAELASAVQLRRLEQIQVGLREEKQKVEAIVTNLRERYVEVAVRDHELKPKNVQIIAQSAIRHITYSQRLKYNQAERQRVERELREHLLQNRLAQIELARKRWAESHPRWAELDKVESAVRQLEQADRVAFADWAQQLSNIGATILPPAELTESIRNLAGELQRLRQAEPELLLMSREEKALQDGLELKAEADPEAVSDVSIELDQLRRQFDTATVRLDGLVKRDEMMQKVAAAYAPKTVEEHYGPEFSESGFADIVETYTNIKKQFAVCGAGTFLLFALPVLLRDLSQERVSPVYTFAKDMGVPVIGSRLLEDHSSSKRHVNWHESNEIRLAALRLQQAVTRPGAVVLFAGIGTKYTPGRLVAAVATCLSNRGERILMINAVCPLKTQPLLGFESTAWVAGNAKQGKSTKGFRKAKTPAVLRTGLSELLRHQAEPEAVIQPTSNPLVDVVDCGTTRFPLEALASRELDELLGHASNDYSLVLMVGPPTESAADFQMLAARADAIVLTADKHSIRSARNRAAVEDLIDLRAPLIGIIE